MILEKINSILRFAVILKDETTPDENVIGEVFLEVKGLKKQPIRHKTGYFLFVDFPPGKYYLTAGGKFYEQKEFQVDTGPIDPREPFIELFINQKKGGHI